MEKKSSFLKSVKLKGLIELALALLAVFAFRSSIAEPFVVPSGSMEPTILPGDRLVVSKLAYGLKFPFTHWYLTQFKEPERGDVIVFKFPQNPSIHYVKRLIGLPGDDIDIRDGVITLNGTPFTVTPEVAQPDGPQGEGHSKVYEEKVGSRFHVVQRLPHFVREEVQHIHVPAASYFFMGDNRDNSNDGRFWGFVPRENLEGKAEWVWLSYTWARGLQLKRFGISL